MDWAHALHGRSGVTQVGLNPLTWDTIDAWARRMGTEPDAEDIEALFVLDAVMLNPTPKGDSDGR